MAYNYGNFCIKRFYCCDITVPIELPSFRSSDFGAANPRSVIQLLLGTYLTVVVGILNIQVLPINHYLVLI